VIAIHSTVRTNRFFLSGSRGRRHIRRIKGADSSTKFSCLCAGLLAYTTRAGWEQLPKYCLLRTQQACWENTTDLVWAL